MKKTRVLCVGLFLLATVGCEPDASEPDAVERTKRDADEKPAEGPEAIAEALGQAFGGGDGKTVETVDFRALRDLLPDELEAFDRTDISGEKTGMGGFKISRAEGEYRDEDDSSRRITLQITDAGGIGQMAFLGAAWTQFEVDKESSDGYERTTEYEGYPAYEKYRSGDRPRSELQMIVGERFFVSVEGQNVEMDELKDAVEEIDLDDLEAMRDDGVEG